MTTQPWKHWCVPSTAYLRRYPTSTTGMWTSLLDPCPRCGKTLVQHELGTKRDQLMDEYRVGFDAPPDSPRPRHPYDRNFPDDD